MAPKKILILNTTYNKGGAAKIAQDLFLEFKKDELFSVFFAYGRGGRVPENNTYHFGHKIEFFIHLFLVRFFGLEGFGSYFSTRRLIKFIKKEKFSLIHIHNLHGYYVDFFRLLKFLDRQGIKVCWTLHDEWLFTWLPAHSMGCNHCRTLSGRCSNRYSYPKNYFPLFSKLMLKKKRELLLLENIEIICPAKWLYKEATEDFNIKKVSLIANGVDSDLFDRQGSKNDLKEKYDLPADKKIILFSANNFKDKNKGGEYFLKLADKLKLKPFIFGVVGSSDFPERENVIKFGYISDRKKIAELYSVADIYCFLSAVETAPLSVLEAMSCALPIVGFNIIALEGIVDNNNGRLVEYGDIADLEKNSVNLLEDDTSLEQMGKNSRQIILDNFKKENFYLSYKNLYKA